MTDGKGGSEAEQAPADVTLYDLRTIDEICDFVGFGRLKFYEAIKHDGFPVFRLGRKYFARKAEIFEWFNGKRFDPNDRDTRAGS